MSAGLGDGVAPLGYGGMRASTADRERAVDVLKAGFAEGRLDQDEYADRVGRVYSSRTYAELAALTADLPIGPLGTMPSMPVQLVPGTPMAPIVPVAPAPPARRQLHPRDLALAASLFAIAGFVTDGITVPLAIVLALLALFRGLRTGQGGTGLATAVLVVGALALLIGLVAG